MGFLDTDFDLGDFIFSNHDLEVAREVLPEWIQHCQPDWLENPKGPLGEHWKSNLPNSACFLIELYGIFYHLIGKISWDSPPKISQKFGDLLATKTDDQLLDLITELQVARILAQRVQPIVFEPLVPPWQTAASDKPRSPDYELQLSDGRMLLEVTVMRVEALNRWDVVAEQLGAFFRRRLEKAKKMRELTVVLPLKIGNYPLRPKELKPLRRTWFIFRAENGSSKSGKSRLEFGGANFLYWSPKPMIHASWREEYLPVSRALHHLRKCRRTSTPSPMSTASLQKITGMSS
jgi:hypothetical protein